MLCETSGEFMSFVQESPLEGFKIQAIVPFSRGFFIAGENGVIYAYERVEVGASPYRRYKTIETKLD